VPSAALGSKLALTFHVKNNDPRLSASLPLSAQERLESSDALWRASMAAKLRMYKDGAPSRVAVQGRTLLPATLGDRYTLDVDGVTIEEFGGPFTPFSIGTETELALLEAPLFMPRGH
jgi:hypothetical protein